MRRSIDFTDAPTISLMLLRRRLWHETFIGPSGAVATPAPIDVRFRRLDFQPAGAFRQFLRDTAATDRHRCACLAWRAPSRSTRTTDECSWDVDADEICRDFPLATHILTSRVRRGHTNLQPYDFGAATGDEEPRRPACGPSGCGHRLCARVAEDWGAFLPHHRRVTRFAARPPRSQRLQIALMRRRSSTALRRFSGPACEIHRHYPPMPNLTSPRV